MLVMMYKNETSVRTCCANGWLKIERENGKKATSARVLAIIQIQENTGFSNKNMFESW